MLVKKSRGKGNKLKVLGIRKIFLRNIEKERNSTRQNKGNFLEINTRKPFFQELSKVRNSLNYRSYSNAKRHTNSAFYE